MRRQSWLRSRREVLEALGLGLGCLPLLQTTRSYAAIPLVPKRFVCVLQPFGYRHSGWLPNVVGPLGQVPLPDSSSPLAPFRDALIMLPGLANPGFPRCGGCAEAAYGTIFSGVGRGAEQNYPESAIPSVDQIVASGIAKSTTLTLRSLALGVMVDAGKLIPRGGRRCFWRGQNAPVDPEESPHALFDWLFSGPAGSEAARRLRLEKRSLLDHVGKELQQYSARLGTEDRASIEQHLGSIREIEQGLDNLPIMDPNCAPPTLGAPINSRRRANFAAVVDLQMKLMVTVLRCDLTRVVTLQLANAVGSGISMDFVPGLPRGGGDWAAIARAEFSGGGSATFDPKRIVDKWFMGQLAKLLGLLSATGPAGATLPDQSAVLWATTMKDGTEPTTQNVPWLLAGKCGGYFKTGQVAASAGKPLHGVLAEICHAMDVPVEFIGDRAFGTPMAGLKV